MKLGEKQEKTVSPEVSKLALDSSKLGRLISSELELNTNVEILGAIYKQLLIAEKLDVEDKISMHEQLKKERDSEKSRNDEIIRALTGRKRKKEKKPTKEEPKEKKPTKEAPKEKAKEPEKVPPKEAPKEKVPAKEAPKEPQKVPKKEVPTKEAPKPEKVPEKVPTKPSAEKAPTPKAPAPKIPNLSGGDKGVMEMIKKHEGVRTKPYKDSLGLWTIGVGHLIGDGKTLPPEWNRELSMQEVDELFAKDYIKHKEMAKQTPGWNKANETGQAAMIDLAFNMGGSWFKKWPNTAKALEEGDFNKAAEGLKDSKWYQQVKGRAVTIVNMIRNGSLESNATGLIPTNQALPVSLEPSTGMKIDSSSKENADLKKVISKNSGGTTIVNNQVNSTISGGSSQSSSGSAPDDRSAIHKKAGK